MTADQPDIEAMVSELMAVLVSLASAFQGKDERWAAWASESWRRLQNRDLSGADYWLQAYGGMGSINDVVASPELAALRTHAWKLARSIQRISN